MSIPAEAAQVVERAAALRHQPLSAFLRDAAIEKANRVLGLEPEHEHEKSAAAAA